MKLIDAWVVYQYSDSRLYYFKTEDLAKQWAYATYYKSCDDPKMIKCILDDDGKVYPLSEPITFNQ
jgi:hypothetical protein